jgi:hypothetical protein
MISCKEATELVSRSLDSPLDWRQRLGLRLHLLVCSLCREFRRQLLFLREALRRYPGPGPSSGR